MKNLTLLIIILFYGARVSAFTTNADSTAQQSTQTLTLLDSLKQQVDFTANDTAKSILYSQIADEYLKYDAISDRKTKQLYQNQALTYTYLALHLYSHLSDTIGLRNCFNNLSRVYRSQRKYPQAKWFILQSNTLSRAKNDVPNILASLIVLANIKMDIKDYTLAMRDLNEALQLSAANHYPKVEANVQESYALLYSHLKEYNKETIALKRRDFIIDSINKKAADSLIAKTRDSLSLQTKKKVFSTVSRKVYKTNSSKRIASL